MPWRSETTPSWRCSTDRARGSPRCAVSTSTTSITIDAPCSCAARAARTASCRSDSPPLARCRPTWCGPVPSCRHAGSRHPHLSHPGRATTEGGAAPAFPPAKPGVRRARTSAPCSWGEGLASRAEGRARPRVENRGAECGGGRARAARSAALGRDPSARRGRRSALRAGDPRPRESGHHADLHPCLRRAPPRGLPTRAPARLRGRRGRPGWRSASCRGARPRPALRQPRGSPRRRVLAGRPVKCPVCVRMRAGPPSVEP